MAEEKSSKHGRRFKDLTGSRFANFTVVAYVGTRGHHVQWECRCDCGTAFLAFATNINSGSTRSCGCIKKPRTINPNRRAHNFKDLKGSTFGRLTVNEFIGSSHGNARWSCRCECGSNVVTMALSLKSGNTKSCGCLARELTSIRTTTHGLSRTRAWDSWYNARSRCFDPADAAYGRYGGRGITMCDEWAESFESFFADMGHCPDDFTIDRINNDGNYEPGNCRWAPRSTQANNTSVTLLITHEGETHTLSEWASLRGIPKRILQHRYYRGRPLFAPVQKRRPSS